VGAIHGWLREGGRPDVWCAFVFFICLTAPFVSRVRLLFTPYISCNHNATGGGGDGGDQRLRGGARGRGGGPAAQQFSQSPGSNWVAETVNIHRAVHVLGSWYSPFSVQFCTGLYGWEVWSRLPCSSLRSPLSQEKFRSLRFWVTTTTRAS
jgi:hypothetical protein